MSDTNFSEFNQSMRIHERVLSPVFGVKLANIFGRKTAAAVDNFYKASSHHKGEQYSDIKKIPQSGIKSRSYMQT